LSTSIKAGSPFNAFGAGATQSSGGEGKQISFPEVIQDNKTSYFFFEVRYSIRVISVGLNFLFHGFYCRLIKFFN
jgi:hypothetical protein